MVYASLLQSAPTDLECLIGLSFVARQRGDRPEALVRFSKAVELHPQAAEPLAEMAVELSHTGQLEKAANAYRGAVERRPQHPWAWIGLGQVLKRQGNEEQAQLAFSRACAVDRNNIQAHLEYATGARNAGALDEATLIIQRFLLDNPRCAAAHLNLAQTLSRSGDRKRAVMAFQSAAELAPSDPQILLELFECHRQFGDYEAGSSALSAALEIDPSHFGILMKLGDLVVGDDPEEALTYYCKAADSIPVAPGPYLGISAAHIELGRLEQALAALDEGERKCGSQPALVVRRSEIMRRIGRTDLARAILHTGCTRHPELAWLQIKVQQMEVALGEFATATQQLAEIEPRTGHERALWHFCRGQVADAEWRLNDSANEYGSAVALHPDEPWFHHELARVNLLRLDFETARKHLSRYTVLATRGSRGKRSPNVSQTHLGQILDEFALGTDVIGEIRDAQLATGIHRVQTFGNIAATQPDSTLASVMFLIAARQADLLRGEHLPGSSPIPRTLVQYWDTPNVPPDIIELMSSWREIYTDLDYKLFNDDTAKSFLKDRCTIHVSEAYARSDHPAQKSDLFRLAWLFAYGGYYVDADDRCIGRIDGQVPSHSELIVYQEEYGTIGNNFIAAVPQHPVIGRALEAAAAAINRGDRDVVWLSTGPGLLTRALVQSLTDRSQSLNSWLDRITILDRWAMSKFMNAHCASMYKRTDRHWSRLLFGPRRKFFVGSAKLRRVADPAKHSRSAGTFGPGPRV